MKKNFKKSKITLMFHKVLLLILAISFMSDINAQLSQLQKLTASDGADSDMFGYSAISADGSTAVVGAKADETSQGAVYVFEKSGTNWSQVAKLTASDGALGDELGENVTISSDGTTIVAGARGAQVGANAGQGTAYVFEKPGGGWATTSTFTAKLTASDGAAGDGFGVVSISSDGSTIIIGANLENSMQLYI